MILGVAYYPEHWPEERWETDARLMREAGITRVRIGEFAWHRMEPKDGAFQFDWLKRAVELLGRHGIKTILGTPTPTYPAWLHMKHPDIHQVNSNGTIREFGMRQDACKNHPGYRDYARRIVTRLADALGKHPDVVAWQTDNEFGCHGTARCWCSYCRKAFQEWLRKRFSNDIRALNTAWGTFFWSQDYNSFDEIGVPRDTAGCAGNDGQNPALVLDFYRFSSDVQVEFQREQIKILRAKSPGRLITHNLMGAHRTVNYFHLAADIDVVSWDNYPFSSNGTNLPPNSMHHDLMRGCKQKNVWVMEQGSGQGGWGSYNATPQPGQMRLWAWQAVARGADMVSFFRWRSCRWGREQYWHGLLYHHGQPQRRYQEAKALGAELAALSKELDGTTVESQVGILFDYDSIWALETQPCAQGFDYIALCREYAQAFARLGVTADGVSLDSDLSRYDLLIAPSMHLITPEGAERLKAYVHNGGTLLLGPRSGVKDTEDAVVDALLPGLLREPAGCHVEDYDNFGMVKNLTMHVRDEDDRVWPARIMADVLVPEGKARTLLTYAGHYYAGKPAAVENPYGNGVCIYLGTLLDESGLRMLAERLLRRVHVSAISGLPECVEVVCRVKPGGTYTFYLNHSAHPVAVDLVRPGVDLISGKETTGKTEIAGFNLLIVKERG